MCARVCVCARMCITKGVCISLGLYMCVCVSQNNSSFDQLKTEPSYLLLSKSHSIPLPSVFSRVTSHGLARAHPYESNIATQLSVCVQDKVIAIDK